jgi:hypothetical protein
VVCGETYSLFILPNYIWMQKLKDLDQDGKPQGCGLGNSPGFLRQSF